MSYLQFDAGSAALVKALEDAARVPNEHGIAAHQLRLDRAVVALMRVHAADALVPQLLRDEVIWGSGTRDQVVTFVDGGPETFITQSGYLNLWDTLGLARQIAEKDRAPAVTEWHIVRAIVERRGEQLASLQVHMDTLQHRLAAWLDIRQPTPEELARTWCFSDTSFFLEGKYFTNVTWHTALNLKPVVLVVPPAIMDELDEWRSNTQRGRQQKRARSVVRRMDELTAGHAHGVRVRAEAAGLELLRIGWEPRAIPVGLTQILADDRLVASALEYSWRRPGLDIRVLTADRGPFEKARRLGLDAVYLPEELRRDPNDNETTE